MHSIVMGISCCAMLILCFNHIGELAAFFFFTHYGPFPLFLFMCITLTVLFLGASVVCVVNNLKTTADLVL